MIDVKNKYMMKIKMFRVIGLVLMLAWMPNFYSIAQTTTVYIVRHAEKYSMDASDPNPPLSDAGKQRVKDLGKTLQGVKFAAVFTTNTIRTEETAKPLARENKVVIQNYDPKNLAALAENIKKNYLGKYVLVVGHSNTVRPTINALGGETSGTMIPDSVYNLLYKVTIDAAGKAKVSEHTYGKK
jgi:2,3-bisphosphoglycerate-dependent phosphoglycerate mutase